MASYCPSCGEALTAGARFCASCGAAVAPACSACGAQLPEGAAFCPRCGTAQEGGDADPGSEELRVVSCLFADLAGFTSHTERSDPEVVRSRLSVYHRRVREAVERWGGTVEKLMGDGVFAVFGVPNIHEDDPERAVRAALRIQESVAELNASDPELDLNVRLGVATGEAIIQLDPGDQNERIIGDVVNTASRLEGVAPQGGTVVDERTYVAVRNVIDCDPLDPVELKGKAAAVPIWRARQARSRYGVAVEESETAEFVGRQEELSLLVDALDRSIARRRPQLVTISGEPGVGKSRMIREFRGRLEDRPDLLVRWRQGRSLPYGEGVTFWALSEIVKSEAGILESEPPEEARAKLDASIDGLAQGVEVDTAWLRQRLAPLAGVGSAEGIERAELFSAWLTYVELLAAKHPLVLVFEDLHWADEALADFLEHVLDWAQDAPVLIVCTARPEWFERSPGWGGGNREAVTIGLAPLSADETARLVAALTGRTVMSVDAQQALLERSGGNPLYLTEFVRLADEKGWLAGEGPPGELPLPDSVQAIIAARLDLLGPEDRALLQTAAVVGRVFWIGALSFVMGDTHDDLSAAIRRIARRELVRPVRRSSMQGQEEFAFAHVLARDVAYGQLPRSEKVRLHRETARWLEAVSGGRAVDVAELLAHHHTTALALEPSTDPELLRRVYRFLILASERAESLDVESAARWARKAAELAPDDLSRAQALVSLANLTSGGFEEVIALLDEAIDLFVSAGDDLGTATAMANSARAAWYGGNRELADSRLLAALDLVEGMPAGVEVATVWAEHAAMLMFAGREEEAVEVAERAVRVARDVGDVSLRARALRIRGSALNQLGNLAGDDDLAAALAIDLDLGNTVGVMVGYNNRATSLNEVGRSREANEMLDVAIAYAEQRGRDATWHKHTKSQAVLQLGEIAELERLTGEIVEASAGRESQVATFGMKLQARLAWIRGDYETAWRRALDFIGPCRDIGDPQVMLPSLGQMIRYGSDAGRSGSVSDLVPEMLQLAGDNPLLAVSGFEWSVPPVIELGYSDQLLEVLDRIDIRNSDWLAARVGSWKGLVDDSRGDARSALDRMLPAIGVGDDLGLVFPTTLIRIHAARNATALGRTELAEELVDQARAAAREMPARVCLDLIEQVEDMAATG